MEEKVRESTADNLLYEDLVAHVQVRSRSVARKHLASHIGNVPGHWSHGLSRLEAGEYGPAGVARQMEHAEIDVGSLTEKVGVERHFRRVYDTATAANGLNGPIKGSKVLNVVSELRT